MESPVQNISSRESSNAENLKGTHRVIKIIWRQNHFLFVDCTFVIKQQTRCPARCPGEMCEISLQAHTALSTIVLPLFD